MAQRKKSVEKIKRIYRVILKSIDCEFYVSNSGVPILFTKDHYSFVYFLSQRCVKVFSSFQQNKPQKCWTFKTAREAINFYIEKTGNYKELPIQK